MIAKWKQTEATFTQDAFEKQVGRSKGQGRCLDRGAERSAEGRQAPIPANPPRAPQNPLSGQHRPGNLYAGVVHPTIGYGIKGVIWYQGESNAGRAWEYRSSSRS
jgi:sialate O-acetylesterase